MAGSSERAAEGAETASPEFTSYYLQRATQEFAEDLDKIRNADDFKGNDALPMLIRSLQQGTSTFSTEDQRRIVAGGAGKGKENGKADTDKA
jgi:ribosome assembly protein 3